MHLSLHLSLSLSLSLSIYIYIYTYVITHDLVLFSLPLRRTSCHRSWQIGLCLPALRVIVVVVVIVVIVIVVIVIIVILVAIIIIIVEGELSGSQGKGVVSNSWLDCVLLSILHTFKPSGRPMFKPPSLGPP